MSEVDDPGGQIRKRRGRRRLNNLKKSGPRDLGGAGRDGGLKKN